jgi:hypothetical protein
MKQSILTLVCASLLAGVGLARPPCIESGMQGPTDASKGNVLVYREQIVNGMYHYQMYNAGGRVKVKWVAGKNGPYHFPLPAGVCMCLPDEDGSLRILAVTPY